MTPVVLALSKYLMLDEFSVDKESGLGHVKWHYCSTSILLGLWSGLIIGFITEYYSSRPYFPVKAMAETQNRRQPLVSSMAWIWATVLVSCL